MGGRWASKLNSGGSFFARQSFASATPFVVKSTACRSLLLPASGQPRPQTLPLRSFLTPLQGRLVTLRRVWACGATLALRDLKKKKPTPASAEIIYWVVSIVRECLGESPFYLKGFASRWSENFQAACSLASACGCFSQSLHSLWSSASSFRSAPPRTLAPLVPSAHASLPASASGSEVLGMVLREC